MTSSVSDRGIPPTSDLTRRALRALDILAGQTSGVGVAVSGGSDSAALLLLAADWAKRSGKRLLAATVDHGLRAEARDEAERVGSLCAAQGIPHTILNWRRPESAGPAGQAEARHARHALLADWAVRAGLTTLALGHTRDDRVETFLMRARRGSGWHGLAGPLPSGPSPVWPEGRGLAAIRPLLAFGREDLRQELVRRGHCWIEDPSNTASRFERVRMRQLASRMDERAINQALRVMDGLAHMRAAVAAEARAALRSVEFEGARARIAIGDLFRARAEARMRLIEALVMAAGGAPASPRREATETLVSHLVDAARPFGGATLGGAWIRRQGGAALLGPAPPRRGETAGPDPDWDRAAALLADPGLEALAV